MQRADPGKVGPLCRHPDPHDGGTPDAHTLPDPCDSHPMSSDAVAWVYRHSPLRGAAFALHQALADSANAEHDYELWMRQRTMASKARISRAAVQSALDAMLSAPASARAAEPALLELLEDNSRSGRPNRYRLLLPDLPVVHETRRQGAQPAGTPVPTSKAGGAQPVGTRVPTEQAPKTQEGTQGSTQAPAAKIDHPMAKTGREVATRLWDWRKDQGLPEPGQKFMAIAKVAQRLLEAGHPPGRVLAAMKAAPTISVGAVELQLARLPGAAQPARAVQQDRAVTEGRVIL